MPCFDAHTHIQFSAFNDDREQVIHRAVDQGIRFVNVGTQRDTSRLAVELAEEHDGLYAAIGLHPIHTGSSYHDAKELGGGEAAKAFVSRGEEFDMEYYKKLAQHPKTVAIGECGLDYYRFNELESRESQIEKQKRAFSSQITLAREVAKPLMIHCRAAFPDLIEIVSANMYGLPPSIIHFFSGTLDEAKKLLSLGFLFTFGGVITFTHDYDEVIKMIPAEHLLSETDAPYVAPVPHRGKRNEPSYVVEVAKRLAEIKEIPLDSMIEQIETNARRVFRV